MTVRLANKPEDCGKLMKLFKKAAPEISRFGDPYDETEVTDLLWDEKHVRVIIAEEGENLQGVIVLYDMGFWGFIETMYVLPEFRSKGVGTQLYEYVLVMWPDRWRTLEFFFDVGNAGLEHWAKKEGFQLKEPERAAIKFLRR